METNHNNQLQKNKPTSLALTELSRPTLAILNEDYPKVKNIESKQEINGLLNFLITILNIKVSSEEEKLQLDKQMVLIFDLIKTKFSFLTIPEIKEAFKMYVCKGFPGIKVFRVLDCVAVGEILQAFTDFRADSLRSYSQKKQKILTSSTELTEEEKEKIVLKGVEEAFQEFKELKKVNEPSEHIFDFLVKKNKIKTNSNPAVIAYYQQKMEEATKQLKYEHIGKTANSKEESRQIKEDLEAIIKGNSPKIILLAKRIILKEFFEKQIKENKQSIF
jgi:hypothetical protein